MRDDERDPRSCVRCGGPMTGRMVGLRGDAERACLDCGVRERVPARSRLRVAPGRHPGPRLVADLTAFYGLGPRELLAMPECLLLAYRDTLDHLRAEREPLG